MDISSSLGPICAFGSSVTWALGSAGYSRLSRGHSPFAVNFARATVALPLFALAVLILSGGPYGAYERLAAVDSTQLSWLALSIFTSYALGDVLFLWSTRSLGVPAALAIASTYPLLTAGAGAWIQGEALSNGQVFGLLLSVVGVVVVILSGAEPTPASSEGAHAAPRHLTSRSLGVALAFGAMLMWALNSIAAARSGKGADPFVANLIRMVLALGMSAGIGRIIAPGTEITLPWRVVRKSVPLFVAEGFGGSLLFLYGLSHSPLAIGSTLASLAPILSVPVAWALGLEKFSVIRTLGVCLAMIGLWFLVGAI